jgi:hypothetical protein
MATTAPTLPPNAQQVIAALHALSTPTAANGDRSVQLAANDWLTSFQHSVRVAAGLLSFRWAFRRLGW